MIASYTANIQKLIDKDFSENSDLIILSPVTFNQETENKTTQLN